jgi:hypothetical protein
MAAGEPRQHRVKDRPSHRSTSDVPVESQGDDRDFAIVIEKLAAARSLPDSVRSGLVPMPDALMRQRHGSRADPSRTSPGASR